MVQCVCACVRARTSYVQLSVVVDRRLACQLAQALGGSVIHHQAQRAVLNQQLDCVEKPVVHRLHAATNMCTQREKGEREGFRTGSHHYELQLAKKNHDRAY